MLTFSTEKKTEKGIFIIQNNITIEFRYKNKEKSQIKSAYWISCSAHFLCRVDALAPAAPTSRSSPSNWQSSWRESLSAGGRTGSLSPPHCPDQTARPWSSSVLPDWPRNRKEREPRSLRGRQYRHSFYFWYKGCLFGSSGHVPLSVTHLYDIFSGLQVQEGRCWSILMLLCGWKSTYWSQFTYLPCLNSLNSIPLTSHPIKTLYMYCFITNFLISDKT